MSPYPIFCTIDEFYIFGASEAACRGVAVEVIEGYLHAQSQEIWSKIQSQFPDGLETWSKDLTMCCAKLAAYDVMCWRGFNPNQGSDLNYLTRYEQAQRYLLGVSRQEIRPTMSDGSPKVAKTGGARVITGIRSRPR